MDQTALMELLKQLGVTKDKIPDALAHYGARFTEGSFPAEVLAWASGLRTARPDLFPPPPPLVDADGVPAGVPEAVWNGLTPSNKLAYWREHHGPEPVQRRVKPYELRRDMPESEQKARGMGTMSVADKLTAYRQWQAEQQGRG